MNRTFPISRAEARMLPARAGRALVGATAFAVVCIALGALLARTSMTFSTVVIGGVALLGVLALSLTRFDAAVALGTALLGFVRIEPAPTDAVFTVVILVAIVTGRLRFERVPLSIRMFVGTFLTINLLSSLEVVDVGRAARFLFITFYLSVFATWLASYVSSETRAGRVFKYYLLAAVLSAGLGVLALFASFPYSGYLTYEGIGQRAKGLFKDPNVFGPFLVPAALIMLEEIVRPRLRITRPSMSWLILAVLGLGVLFSYSRAAWFNIATGLLVLLAVLALRRNAVRRLAAAMTVLTLVIAFSTTALALSGSLSFLHDRARFQTYDNQRFAAQREGVQIGLEHPLGIGPGQFELAAPISAHSIYVRAVAEYGVPGLLVLLGLLIGTLILAARSALLGRDTYGIGSAALLAAWCGLLVNGAFVDTLHWRHLWLVAALIWAGAMRGGQAPAVPWPQLPRAHHDTAVP